MPKLTEQYGIPEDSRYEACAREARFCLAIFLGVAFASVGSIYALTAGRSPEEYGSVLGIPDYLFWGIFVTHLGFMAALLLGQRFLFKEVSLEPQDPKASS